MTSARTRSGAISASPVASSASARSEPSSAANHFTATEASTIRLIVVAVLTDQVGGVDVRIGAHCTDAPRLRDQLLAGGLHELAQCLLRGVAQRASACGCLLLQAS